MAEHDVEVAFDEEARGWWAVWPPGAIGWGSTRHAALDDLRQAAHLAVDALIDLRLEDTSPNG